MLERQMQERAEREAHDRIGWLQQRMDDETLEADERRAATNEYVAISSQIYAQQLQKWEAYKRDQIVERKLDPTDTRFNKVYSPGQAGLNEFQADLTAAENEVLKRELAQAKKSAVTPETLSELVRKELARITAAQGYDKVDLGEPAGNTDDDDAWERDTSAFNNGRMSAADYNRKWGKPRR